MDKVELRDRLKRVLNGEAAASVRLRSLIPATSLTAHRPPRGRGGGALAAAVRCRRRIPALAARAGTASARSSTPSCLCLCSAAAAPCYLGECCCATSCAGRLSLTRCAIRTWRRAGTWERIQTALLLRCRLRVQRGRDGGAECRQQREPIGQDYRRGQRARVGRMTEPSNWSGAGATSSWTPRASSSRSLSSRPTALGELDGDGIKRVLDDWILAQLPRMQLLRLDAGYNGRGKGERAGTGSSAPSAGGSRRSKPCTATNASGCLRA